MKFFSDENSSKKQFYSLFIIFIIIILFFVSISLFQKPSPKLIQKAVKPAEVKIDFNLLENPLMREFQIYRLITLPEEGTSSTSGISIGRPNPFSPYY